ncbi:MAG: UDP-N-acetylglucosamine 1-carboxyvinyltransferase [Erysipelotrichaceae bacterium]|nr:UDP-N-acetylglucosamine 1-carboxyvinyltransferase [Erysipelotrichaceae bacterium]
MKRAYEITGRSQMEGIIKIQGSKNSALAIIVATLFIQNNVELHNVPRIKDVFELIEILKKLNVNVSFKKNVLKIDSSTLQYNTLLFKEIKQFRASYYFIGAFLAIFHRVNIFLPGGCKIGKRPIDQHIKGLSSLNVNIHLTQDRIQAYCNEIIGKEITLDIASVGATINILFASLFAKGKTIIRNAAKEPEIVDLVRFLKRAGANIYGEGSDCITIIPVEKLNKTIYTIMPDRIVTGTYLIYGALLANKLTLKNIKTSDNYALINTLINLGATINIRKKEISITRINRFINADIKTGVYPLFPSDLQQILTTMLFYGQNVSFVEETVFENRFNFLYEIEKMGGQYLLVNKKAIIIPSTFHPSVVSANDLRGGAALLLACMLANGTSVIKNIEYIERGYENIVKLLQKVHVDIKEITLNEA